MGMTGAVLRPEEVTTIQGDGQVLRFGERGEREGIDDKNQREKVGEIFKEKDEEMHSNAEEKYKEDRSRMKRIGTASKERECRKVESKKSKDITQSLP
jgi:hypothetical protein